MDASQAAKEFSFSGSLVAVDAFGSGNVNDTFLAVFRTPRSEERGIIQRINRHVFKNPLWIMENMKIVTEHVHRKLGRGTDAEGRVWQFPRLIPTKEGKDYHIDASGDWWRAMTVIRSAVSHDRARGPWHALEAGVVLGHFHRLLSDLNPALLKDTLPNFHVTPAYLEAYDETLRLPETMIRIQSSPNILMRLARFIDERRAFAEVLVSAHRRGALKTRLIHGDPKVANILIDSLTNKGTSIVDLDTVKPGLVHYDFGDALRSIANPAGEDAADLDEVRFDEELGAAFVKGYMSQAGDFLGEEERRYLYDSIRLIAFELGLRFFQDYLAGNAYFKVRSPEQNLHRAKVQFRLCECIEAAEARIHGILCSYT